MYQPQTSLQVGVQRQETNGCGSRCFPLDEPQLRTLLDEALGEAGALDLSTTHPNLLALAPVVVPSDQVLAMQTVVNAVERVVGNESFRQEVIAHAPGISRANLGPHGAFVGYDFHLTDDGPRLIEINSNAGGALLGLHLARAQRAASNELCQLAIGHLAPAAAEGALVEMFRSEMHYQFPGRDLGSIAIVDRDPPSQFLHPELKLFRRLFERHGIRAVIVDPRELRSHDRALWHDDRRIDLVYNRLTDFYLEHAENAAIREAYLAGHVVLTPHPRTHALYASKQNLTILSDPQRLRALGVDEETIAILERGVPETVLVEAANAAALWDRRRRLFFKPVARYGGKGAYDGGKLTRRVWQDILASDYVAQDRVPPSEQVLLIDGEEKTLKLDLRCVVYDGDLQLLGARLYRGQTTNLRTPGGGIASVFTTAF